MISFRIDGEELDLNPDTSVQIEYFSGLFEIDRIPGVLTYPITLPWSKKNKRLLGFPGNLSVRAYRKEPFTCDMYLQNLWRSGKLYILGTNSKGISINFQSEVGDLGEGFKNDSLRDLDLGTDVLVHVPRDIYPASNYALFPVRNDGFYGDKNPDYCFYLNYYDQDQEQFALNQHQSKHARVPFPYLVHIMCQVMAHYGYSITGSWINSEEARRLVIFNVQDLDKMVANEYGRLINLFEEQIHFNRHVPDMKVNEFMKAIRATFCLGFIFNSITKTMEVVRLKDVIQDTSYVDWQKRNLSVDEWTPNTTKGFKLSLSPDNNDELNEALPQSAYLFKVGQGEQEIKFNTGTVQMLKEEDSQRTGRRWLVPHVKQEGTSEGFETENDFKLSLLSYQGLQADSQGQKYPLASSLNLGYSGQKISNSTLSMAPDMLFEQCHKPWLEYLSETEQVDANIDLTITDVRTLRQDRKVMVQTENSLVKALWSKISISISLKDGLKTAKATFLKVRN